METDQSVCMVGANSGLGSRHVQKRHSLTNCLSPVLLNFIRLNRPFPTSHTLNSVLTSRGFLQTTRTESATVKNRPLLSVKKPGPMTY